MRKVISFSLWGDNPKYTIGAIRNAEMAPFVYPDWETWFYVADNVPRDIIERLKQSGSKIINKNNEDWDGMFWRFYPMSDPSVDIFISRDTDSRLNYRERRAVDAWIDSGKKLHIMRDHSYHGTPILGGMWGFRGSTPDIKDQIDDFIRDIGKSGYYDVDQFFLRSIIYTKYQEDSIAHDEFFGGIPFPSPREGHEYVGAPFDAFNNLEIPFI